MNRRDFIGGAAIALATGARALAQTQGGTATGVQGDPTRGFHDLMPDFWRVYDASRGIRDPQQRAHAIGMGYMAPHADVYYAEQFGQGGARGPIDDRRVQQWLTGFDPLAPATRAISEQLPAAWAAHGKRFRQAFTDYDADAPVYVLISFGQFNANTRPWRGAMTLFIGPDAIVQQQGEHADLNVLLDQEAFHLYQQQVNPALTEAAGTALWSRLWREGLAEYASAKLNPGAAQDDVLMDGGRLDLFPAASIVGELMSALDSTSPLDAARFFDQGYQGDLPPRTGYLLGLMVAQRVGRNDSLPQLARLPAAQARMLVQTGLSEIANG